MMPDDVNDALLRRIEELERANRDLRAQLRERDRLSRAAAQARESTGRDHAREISSAASHIATLRNSRASLEASENRLRESEKKLRQIADSLPALIAYVDEEQRYRFNNKAYEAWLLRSPKDLYGLSLREAVGDDTYRRVKPFIDAVLSGRSSWHEWWAPFPGGLRFVRSEYIPDFREDGSVAGFYVLVSDLTDIKRSQAAQAESEARLRLAVDAGRMAIWETETASDTVTSSPELNRLLGFPPGFEPTLDDIRERYAPGEKEKLRRVSMDALARGDRYAETELQVVWPDGSRHWLLLRAEMQEVRNGSPGRTIGVALDITGRKKAEAHQQLLINELNHRVKNTLATVQSIVTQSLRNAATAAEARDAVEGRLFALSRAHDVLTRENWDGASLSEVVQQAIAPFQGLRDRFEVSGVDIRLPPRIALAIAMALQELGTNAAKYGALTGEAGRIAIEWSMRGPEAGQRLRFVWQERGGPPVSPPARRGFGTRLIERSLAQELNGSVVIDFAPGGVVCIIDAPLAEG